MPEAALSATPRMEAFFAPLAGGERFCVFHAPAQPARGAVVHVHPFAEEMNLSRHMAAMQARELAAAGYAVLQMDLLGCGDSAGDFHDASWSAWIDDVVAAVGLLRARVDAPLCLWGVRAGCLLAAQAAAVLREPCNFLFWQPVLSGETHWRQFLRIRTAAGAIGNDGDNAGETASAAAAGVGEAIEVAGYRVAPELVTGLMQARLELPALAGRALVLEVSSATGDLTPALAAWIARGQGKPAAIAAASVVGPFFWQTPESPECLPLLAATATLLRRDEHGL